MKKLLLILALAISANAWAHVTGNVELKCNEINGEQEYLVNLPTETHGMGMIEDINRSMKFDIKFLVLTPLGVLQSARLRALITFIIIGVSPNIS